MKMFNFFLQVSSDLLVKFYILHVGDRQLVVFCAVDLYKNIFYMQAIDL